MPGSRRACPCGGYAEVTSRDEQSAVRCPACARELGPPLVDEDLPVESEDVPTSRQTPVAKSQPRLPRVDAPILGVDDEPGDE